MLRAVYLQVGLTVIAVLILGAVVGTHGAVSAGLGGLACVLPNAWFAWRLTVLAKRESNVSHAASFFIGEFIKVAATVGLLAIAIKAYPAMHWPSLLIGMALALQASFFAIWKKS